MHKHHRSHNWLGDVAPRGAVKLLHRERLADAPNVLDLVVHSCPRRAHLVGCHSVTDQKHPECQKHLDLRPEQPIWFECLTKKPRTRCLVLLMICAFGLIIRARTEAIRCLGRDLQLPNPHPHKSPSTPFFKNCWIQCWRG